MIGAGLALATQSSSVAAAMSVAMVSAGLLTMPAALPIIAGANTASVLTNLSRLRREAAAGRIVFTLQAVQKFVGSLLLGAMVVLAALAPPAARLLAGYLGTPASAQIALLFMLAQLAGALVTGLIARPIAALIRRFTPLDAAQTLAQPAILLHEAWSDPPAALDLAMRELARLSARLPLLLLEHVRAEPEPGTPSAKILRAAGITLSETINTYLTNLLDHHPRRSEVATALLLQTAAGNAGALHEALAEFALMAPAAAALSTAGRLIEAVHALMSEVADYAETLGTDDPEFVLDLLGSRDRLVVETRQAQRGVGSRPVSAFERLALLRQSDRAGSCQRIMPVFQTSLDRTLDPFLGDA